MEEPEKFKFLVDQKGRNKKDVALLNYEKRDLISKIFVWNSVNTHFYVFNSIDQLEEFILSKPPSERTYHEVIFSQRPQKLKFDIDRATPQAYDEIMSAIKVIWRTSPILKPYAERKNVDMFIFNTSDLPGLFSRHVIIDYYVPNATAAKTFYEEVCSTLKNKGHHSEKYLDPRYSSIQNFRLMFCAKNADGYPKTPITEGTTFRDSIISFVK